MAEVVAQLAEQSLPTPEVYSSNAGSQSFLKLANCNLFCSYFPFRAQILQIKLQASTGFELGALEYKAYMWTT